MGQDCKVLSFLNEKRLVVLPMAIPADPQVNQIPIEP